MSDEDAYDPMYKEIPKGKPCFFIWRVVAMKLEKVPAATHGQFYTGDCYLLYSSKETKGRLEQDIHYWIGSQSSQDEQGVVAFKTVGLDTYLGGAPVQHREVEGAESPTFVGYFNKARDGKAEKGLKYMEGGAASGFNHVTYEHRDALYHVKGKSTPRVRETKLKWDSFNDGDCFVLDLGKGLFVWKGTECSRSESLKASQWAVLTRDERGGSKKCALFYIDSGSEGSDLEGKALDAWNNVLPLSERTVKSKEAGGDDKEAAKKAAAQIKLYVCREEGGTLKVTEVKLGPLSYADLDKQDAFIVDNGEAGVWCWVGGEASPNERKYAMANAENFSKKKGYPASTPITRVVDGGEPQSFKSLFRSWPSPAVPVGQQKPYQFNHIAKTQSNSKFDATTLHTEPRVAAETQMVDDGTGTIEVFRVERVEKGEGADYVLKQVPEKFHGHFYGGDCYIVCYTYFVNNRRSGILYYWIGQHSTTDEKGAVAVLTVQMDREKFDDAAVQTRVIQGKEPRHFMTIFKGFMIIYAGGHGGWGDSSAEEQAAGPNDDRLFHVFGMNDWDRKCVEVDFTAESLNSNDVFVLISKSAVYIWTGKGSTGDERQVARTMTEKWTQREPVIVIEGQEKKDFWDAIGGEKPYASDRRSAETHSFTPRLFQCSNASGRFVVEEILSFTQTDLCPEDVHLLDADDCLYGWVGQDSNKDERKLALQTATEYIGTDPAGRDPDMPIVIVKQGFEPPTFTGFFHYWDNDMWSNNMTYEQLKAAHGKDADVISLSASEVERRASKLGPNTAFENFIKYPYATLQLKGDDLPVDVDATCKERYLEVEEFDRIFGMTYAEFTTKPNWKQQDLKKANGLF